jgi:hypothetical protein
MARLWIANSTKQNHEFIYRPRLRAEIEKTQDGTIKPVFGESRKQHIPVGGQICVGGSDGLSDGEIRNILDQHPSVPDFKSLNRVKGYQGLCYRIGPDNVPMDEIMERIEKNDEVRTEEAKDRQASTALKIASNMRNVASQDDAAFKDLRETDVQVAQKGDKEVNGGTPKMNQVVEVTEDGKTASGRGRKSAA